MKTRDVRDLVRLKKFNADAKTAGISIRWEAKTILRPFWWGVISAITYFIALFLTKSDFDFVY